MIKSIRYNIKSVLRQQECLKPTLTYNICDNYANYFTAKTLPGSHQSLSTVWFLTTLLWCRPPFWTFS